MAFQALPQGLTTVLDVIDNHPRGWTVKRKKQEGFEVEFHLAKVSISYRDFTFDTVWATMA